VFDAEFERRHGFNREAAQPDISDPHGQVLIKQMSGQPACRAKAWVTTTFGDSGF
jgi:hypothetical protein